MRSHWSGSIVDMWTACTDKWGKSENDLDMAAAISGSPTSMLPTAHFMPVATPALFFGVSRFSKMKPWLVPQAGHLPHFNLKLESQASGQGCS